MILNASMCMLMDREFAYEFVPVFFDLSIEN